MLMIDRWCYELFTAPALNRHVGQELYSACAHCRNANCALVIVTCGGTHEDIVVTQFATGVNVLIGNQHARPDCTTA